MNSTTNPDIKQPSPKTNEANASMDAEVTKRLLAKGYSADDIKAAMELPTVIVRDLEKED